MSRRTTWTAPFRKNLRTANGEKRRNPIHNQIDFILIDKKYARFLKNARSYSNLATDSDHNMVMTNIDFEFSRLNKPKTVKSSKINTANFRNKKLHKEYTQKVEEQYDNKEATNNNERWQNIVETCLKVGEEVLGNKEKKKQTDQDIEIKRLSDMRKTIKRQITDSTSIERKESLKKERLYIKKEINYRMKKLEEKEIDEKMAHIESIKDDNTRYHYAMRDINKPTQKVPILVKDSEGNIPGSTSEKIKIIEEYFKKTLAPLHMQDEYLDSPPCKMATPFTAAEITSIVKRLGNDKAAGPDRIQAEFLKYAPQSIHQEIANIFNITAETGDVPTAMIHGLLCPLQKPGKKKGPPENLRPIILLSILRKILTISLLDRTWNRLAEKIPKTQAAYQRGRGTTEQVLALKLLIEKAIISSDLDIYILLLDMSKAFDTVNRKILLSDLATTLNPDEVHLLGVLTNRPLISIFLDGEIGEGFNSYVGICQGDCLSAVLFIFYLSNALSNNLQDTAAAEQLKALLDIFYADDLTYVTLTSTSRKDIKEDTPRKLERYNLFVNLGKTEEGEAPDRRPPPPPPPPPDEDPGTKLLYSALDWMMPEEMSAPEPNYKDIKLLGSKLNTQKDISTRKNKVWQPIQKYRHHFKSKRLSTQHKVRIFKTYVETTLLYNSETWALTSTLEKSLDAFHRRLLRIALNIRYPKTISNQHLYNLTKQTPISERIKKRRLALFGHILRLPPDTPAQQALHFYLTPHRRPVGRPPLTWLALVTKDLRHTLIHHNIKTPLNKNSIDRLSVIAKDNTAWRIEIERSMESNL